MKRFKIIDKSKNSSYLKPTKLAFITLVFCLLISAIIGIILILIGDFGEIEFKTLGTAATLAGFSIVSLPSLFYLERYRYQFISKFGFISCTFFFSLILLLIWVGEPVGEDIFFKVTATFGIFSFSTNHILLILIAKPVTKFILISQRLTTIAISILALLLLLAIWTIEDMPGFLARITAAISIIVALGTIAVPILTRINTKNI